MAPNKVEIRKSKFFFRKTLFPCHVGIIGKGGKVASEVKDMIGTFHHPLLGIMLLVCVKLLFKVEKLLNKLNIFYAPKDFGRGSGHTADKQQHTAQLNIIWKIFFNNAHPTNTCNPFSSVLPILELTF